MLSFTLDANTWVDLVGALLGPLIIGLFFGAFERRRERSRELSELFRYYNGAEVLGARARAWAYLSTDYAAVPLPWSLFYSDRRTIHGVDRSGPQTAHDDIVMVASAFTLLAVLIQEKRVDPGMAKRLFATQYQGWAIAFRQIRDVTSGSGEKAPEWASFLSLLDSVMLDPVEAPFPNRLPIPIR